MRIAVTNWSIRKVGGAESYLSVIIPELARLGHELAFWAEVDIPADRTKIALPGDSPVWCVATVGADQALEKFRAWKPDVVYGHGLTNPELESRTIEAAPGVLFAHNYSATCISGDKTFRVPWIKQCTRRFGWQCLLHFYPRRCGGLNPITMWRLFRVQASRLALIGRYKRILVASEYMRREYLRHGFVDKMVEVIPLPVWTGDLLRAHDYEDNQRRSCRALADKSGSCPKGKQKARKTSHSGCDGYCLLFVGRMVELKGGLVLLNALSEAATTLGGSIRMVFVGDGPARSVWEACARRLSSENRRLRIEFTGWLVDDDFDALVQSCDLLVLPSLWPEPFGLVGPEAGTRGLPAAAFDVGGIADWLTDGVNGYLAAGDPPSAEGLAQAIIRCLKDPSNYQRLRQGAIESAQRFSLRTHVAGLLNLFDEVIRQ